MSLAVFVLIKFFDGVKHFCMHDVQKLIFQQYNIHNALYELVPRDHNVDNNGKYRWSVVDY